MRVSYTSFSGHLNQGLGSLYLLFGDEILLLEEALDQLRQVARGEGFNERMRYGVDKGERGFDWNQALPREQSMSLFSDKKIIELRIPTGKPGIEGAAALAEYANAPQSADTILVVISGAIDKRAQGSKWFKAFESRGITTECPLIGSQRLPGWIGQRMKAKGLGFDQGVTGQLAYFVEGNLLAAAQEIDLLALLAKDKKVTEELVQSTIADHARFSIYTFSDACLTGSTQRLIRILQSLKQGQIEPILILWSLTRETRTLCQLAAISDRGGNPRSEFQRLGVWSSRAGLISAALSRLSLGQCRKILRRLAYADLQLKGRAPVQRKDMWEEIESIGLEYCGVSIP